MQAPNPVVRMMQAAVQAHQSGRLAEAEQAYRQVLSIEPRNPDALHLLGVLAYQVGQSQPSVSLIERAVAIKPNEPVFLVNLGQAYRKEGRLDAAENTFRRAVQLDPNLAEGYSNLAALLWQRGKLDEAEAAARKAAALNPRLAAAQMNVGAVLKDKGDFDGALHHYQLALKLGAAPHEVMNNIGEVHRAVGNLQQAKAAFDESIRHAPTVPVAYCNSSLIDLLQGQWDRGFAAYEWRLKLNVADTLPIPMWDGTPLDGRSILVHTEQGFGDAIQFVRYVPLLAGRGARVVVQCQPELVRLFKTVQGASQIVPKGEATPATDVQAPLMSLPYLFKTTPTTAPADVPYLHAEATVVGQWQQRIPRVEGTRNIGLVWSGNPRHSNDQNRSIAPSVLSPLGDVPNVRWYSLQKNPAAMPGFSMTDLAADIHDFADTAAALSVLDLLICVDTAPAHLAGALARPTWLLLPHVPDWRWMLDRNDSVWYPTMRLFRQRERGDWTSAIADVAHALSVSR